MTEDYKEFWSKVKRHSNGSFVFEYNPDAKSYWDPEKGIGWYCPYEPVFKEDEDG